MRKITERLIDIRSDTSSLPTDQMREAMKRAKVGNDGYGEDPTVNRLEELAAEKMGKEAALFVPSGTMGNLLALLCHTDRGDEIIVEDQAHIITRERGYAYVAGLEVSRIKGHYGAMDVDDVEEAILTSRSLKVSLLCMENTHNNAGGLVIPIDNITALHEVAEKHGISTHLDGARIFNASTALGCPARKIVKDVDSMMFCLSKGLCAPVGSMLVGTRDFIKKGRQIRKVIGGQMRQAGVIAAAGIVALETMIGRIKEDHDNARLLGEGLAKIDGIEVNLDKIQSNMVYFSVGNLGITAKTFASELLKDYNIKINTRGKTLVRAVFYKDVSREDTKYVLNAIQKVALKHSARSNSIG